MPFYKTRHRALHGLAFCLVLIISTAALALDAQARTPQVEAPSAPPAPKPVTPPAPAQPDEKQDSKKSVSNGCDQEPVATPMAKIAVAPKWQPHGGVVHVEINQAKALPADAVVRACFRWKRDGATLADYKASPSVTLDSVGADGAKKVSVVVPQISPSGDDVMRSWMGLEPIAEMHVVVWSAGAKPEVLVDHTVDIAITDPWIGAVTAFLVFLLLLVIIALGGITSSWPKIVLRAITTSHGYASLSQLQILLWTLTIGAAMSYVMAMSGELIAISNGALVLLGISGVAVVTSKLHSAKEDADAAAATAKATKDALSAGLPAPAPPAPAPARDAKWADLISTDGVIDIPRVQMLFFTVIVAAYVLLEALTSYKIPDLPETVLLLLGISNGVYLSAKVATPPQP